MIRPLLRVLMVIGLLVQHAQAAVGAQPRLAQAQARGLAFLATQQQPSGAWPQQVCADWLFSQHCREDPTTWATGFVLRSLAAVTQPRAASLRHQAARFLQREQRPGGLWAYWTLTYAPEAGHDVLPDVSTTSLVAEALAMQGVSSDVAPTLRAQLDHSGRVTYWIIPPGMASSPGVEYDCMADANVLWHLARFAQPPATVCAYLLGVVRAGLPMSCSPYYVDSELLAYTVAGALQRGAVCLAPIREELAAWLSARQRPDGSWGAALLTAAAVNALLDVGGSETVIRRGVAALLNQQGPDGSWPARLLYLMNAAGKPPTRALVYDAATQRVRLGAEVIPGPWFFASSAVTTALALEALATYEATLP